MIAVWLGIEIACLAALIQTARWVAREWRHRRDVIVARSRPVPFNPVAARILADAASDCDCDCDDCVRLAAYAKRLLTERDAEIASLEAAYLAPAYLRSQP